MMMKMILDEPLKQPPLLSSGGSETSANTLAPAPSASPSPTPMEPSTSVLTNVYGDSVAAALVTIEEQHQTITAQFEQCTTGDKTLPPELLEIFKCQTLDSVGVLYGGLRQAEAQLASLKANPISALGDVAKKAKAVRKKRMADLTKEIAEYTAKMDHCHDEYCNVLKIPLDTAEANLPTLKKSMPVAATATTTSMQRELGKLWLINKAKQRVSPFFIFKLFNLESDDADGAMAQELLADGESDSEFCDQERSVNCLSDFPTTFSSFSFIKFKLLITELCHRSLKKLVV